MLRVVLLLARAIPPRTAAVLASWAVGAPWIAPDLVRICKRESPGHDCRERVGVHARDAWVSDSEWKSQVRLGHLNPICQPYRERVWATHGNWGLSAASHWQFLPPCYPPEILDVPIVSAYAAAQKFLAVCRPTYRSRWCGKAGVSFAFSLSD